ncbi:hypothetical protein [Janthinobacterium sp. 17J80-10]|uniref:hypothetical protein n=1 Tax=Janthinobacterium sp. 17J80-10 TaxID=2497863 RepID=UPI00100532F7|nr:hypothetical protein [Janthinobacterium sp. 17J80-10]QAU34584.1 hypothetical protein EKL02_10545 [Janthinobacterium sp. 17J80-10]
MQNQFENALAWFGAAPTRWIKSARQDLSAAAEWLWGVLQGDFNDNASTAQTITGTVISMIPLVDQLCDVRDVVANCRKINEDSSNQWTWVALVLTLIGLFPTLGSLVKGCFKILFAYGRKAAFKTSAPLAEGLWNFSKPWVETGIGKLNQFLARPEVRKAMAALKWDNPYKELARFMRELAGKINTAALVKVMDEVIGALKKLLNLVQKWGSAAMATKAGALLDIVMKVRKDANAKLGEVVKPVQDWLDQLAKRLDVEAENNYRAATKSVNGHTFSRTTLDTEVAAIEKAKPTWVDKTKDVTHKPAKEAPIQDGWPDLSDVAKGPTKSKYDTFEAGKIEPVTIPPGETLYRIVDPASSDNNICWMRKAEFDKLKSKDEWRRKFAVWGYWNHNGEFVTYTVPPGKGLNVWEGTVGTQELKGKPAYKLEGGATQIVLDPAHLKQEHIGIRQATNWGYSNFGETTDLVGVPILTNNWHQG